MLTRFVWTHLGAPVAAPGEEKTWGDNHPIANNAIRTLVFVLLFIAITLVMSKYVYPNFEHIWFGESTVG